MLAERHELVSEWEARAARFAEQWFGPAQGALFAELDRSLASLHALRIGASPAEDLRLLRIVVSLWAYWSPAGLGQEVTEWISAALRRSAGSLDPELRFSAQWVRAWIAFDTQTLEGVGEIVADLTESAVSDEQTAALEQVLGVQAFTVGELPLAEAHLHRALEAHMRLGLPEHEFLDVSYLAVVASTAGAQERAYGLAEHALRVSVEHGDRLLRTYVIWAFAVAAWRAGERHRAYVLALDGVLNGAGVGDFQGASICLDIVAWHLSESGDARSGAEFLGFADGLRHAKRLPYQPLGAEADYRTAVDQILSELSAEEFDLALSQARETPVREILARVRARSAGGGGSATTRSISTGLTPRQREIAMLIADGLTNKEIAQRLLISVSTVETHIENMFRRLGVSSRAQIAAWAAGVEL